MVAHLGDEHQSFLDGDHGAALIALVCTMTWASAVIAAEWLAGDLHLHSTHSDGTNSVEEVVADAEAKGLDFIALTDHDEPDGDMSHWFDPAYVSGDLVLLSGVEWTCPFGHATFLSTEPFDYGPMWEANLTFQPRLAYLAAVDQDVSMSIAHPRRPAFSWNFIWRLAPLIEIWNGKTSYPVEADVAFWEEQLLADRRVVGIGGSDMHCLDGGLVPDCPVDSVIGAPTTWVYADHTPRSILEAIDAGRVTISASPDAPRLVIDAESDSIVIHLENVDADSPTLYLLEVVQDGSCVYRSRIVAAETVVLAMKSSAMYYRAELYSTSDQGGDSRLVALTNPVYVSDSPPPGP
jgi:hypothetical protein